MTNTRRLLSIPPPVIILTPFIIGAVLHRYWPLARFEPSWAGPIRWIGFALALIGVVLGAVSIGLFLAARTTPIPHRRTSSLVISGAYRWTRNPMYLGLFALYLGLSLYFGMVWPLILLPVPIVIMDRFFVPAEERKLAEELGEGYHEYRTRVRRWF